MYATNTPLSPRPDVLRTPLGAVAGQPGHEIWARVGKWVSDDYSLKRSLAFGAILTGALVAFEIFNFSTTEFALQDLLGEARFLGLQWATILSIAFCGIDFAGLARLFTPSSRGWAPERRQSASLEVWYLVGAWFLGATMNAMMTWWAVSLTMIDHTIGNEVLSRGQLLTYVPIFVATLVWLTRILIIGTFSVAGERLFFRAREVATAAAREARKTQHTPEMNRQPLPARPVAHRSPNAVSHVRERHAAPAVPAHRRPAQGPKAQYVGTKAPDERELKYESFEEEEPDTHTARVRPAPKPMRMPNGVGTNGAQRD